jgi:hypothetical protein
MRTSFRDIEAISRDNLASTVPSVAVDATKEVEVFVYDRASLPVRRMSGGGEITTVPGKNKDFGIASRGVTHVSRQGLQTFCPFRPSLRHGISYHL